MIAAAQPGKATKPSRWLIVAFVVSTLYIYLIGLLQQINPSAPVSGWYWITTLALFFSLPIWVVQGLAFIGLLQKHDSGAILAVITCLLWIMSIIGLPFGIAGLFVLWRWQLPALRPQVSGAPA